MTFTYAQLLDLQQRIANGESINRLAIQHQVSRLTMTLIAQGANVSDINNRAEAEKQFSNASPTQPITPIR